VCKYKEFGVHFILFLMIRTSRNGTALPGCIHNKLDGRLLTIDVVEEIL
jgi:hypothetical protein